MSLPGIIFDMDDTLVETGPLWKRAEHRLLAAMGHAWSPEIAAQHKGMNAFDIAATIHRLLPSDLSREECQRLFRDALFEEFGRELLRAMPGALECVRGLAHVAPMAVASGSPLPLIEMALEQTGLKDSFSNPVTSESVARGKPFPDVFLAAADALRRPPARCLVIEDSLIGMQAAHAAGMACFLVPSLDLKTARPFYREAKASSTPASPARFSSLKSRSIQGASP